MKKLVSIAIISILMIGCSKVPDDSKTKFTTSDRQEWKQVPTGKLNQFGNPEMTTIYYYQEWATIQPTMGQAFYFASKAGYKLWMWIGIILLGLFGYALRNAILDNPLFQIGKWKVDPGANVKNGGRNIGLTLLLLLVASLCCLLIQPLNVRWRNYKTVDKSHYESVVAEAGDSKPLWDSLLVNGHIIGGPNKK